MAIPAIAALPFSASAISVEFSGQRHKILDIAPDSKSGLEKLFVAYDASEIETMIISDVAGNLEISRYGNMGGGYAEPVQFQWDGNTAIVDRPEGNRGYILTQNGRNYCIWFVDYSTSKMTLNSVDTDGTQDCDNTRLTVNGDAPAIHYYSIDGRPIELSRDIELSYYTEVWDNGSMSFNREPATKVIPHLTNPYTLTPPLYCRTEVTVSGDRFLEEWGMGLSVTSPTLSPNGLEVHTEAVQTNLPEESDEESNIVNGNTEGLGGSAPADIRFTAYATEGVIHHEWQISSDPEFSNTDFRFNEQEVEYSFTEEGTYYVRYIGSNADGTCEVYGETYTVGIGSSELRIPNAFTPNDDGVNDVWKVGYRSLLDFKCWIFDRYGNEIYHFNDPSGGWDGKYKGKTVKPGVYYYVIEAKGADGKKYKKGGDINILNYKKPGSMSGAIE